MATTHVFIVDINTFKYHLEYLFAGTGAREESIDFNNSSKSKLHFQRENNLVAMIADACRVRKGDYIIFYLQQNYSQRVYEGKFYGIFRAKNDISFLDNNDEKQFLKRELNKSLTFRTLIEPYEVYPKGVTEWEALDEIKYINSPCQMLWSLIYRKLKANRGNTMITIYESERLFKLIRDKNKNIALKSDGFSFDIDLQEIKESKTSLYTGRMKQINLLPRLLRKYEENKSFEIHLQAYLTQNIGRNTNKSLNETLLENKNFEWLGNEVYCGVGMQRIDILLSIPISDIKRIIIPIELKSTYASPDNILQLQRYVDWLEQYYIPNRISDIQPVLISLEIENKNGVYFKRVLNAFNEFNENNHNCMPLKFIEFKVEKGNSIIFKQINYK
ncbi:MAG: DUF91 domain-containing protein [bacterium]